LEGPSCTNRTLSRELQVSGPKPRSKKPFAHTASGTGWEKKGYLTIEAVWGQKEEKISRQQPPKKGEEGGKENRFVASTNASLVNYPGGRRGKRGFKEQWGQRESLVTGHALREERDGRPAKNADPLVRAEGHVHRGARGRKIVTRKRRCPFSVFPNQEMHTLGL